MIKKILLKIYRRLFRLNVRFTEKGKGFGFIKSPKDIRDYKYPVVTHMPADSNVNLLTDKERVKYQGRLGTCYAFATIDWFEHEMNMKISSIIDCSEMFFSWCMRRYYGDIGNKALSFPNDKGAYLRDCFKQMRTRNMITDERFCPYITDNFNQTPSTWASAMSSLFSSRVKTFWSITCKEQVTEALFDNHRIVVGIRLDEGFIKNKTGIIEKIDVSKLRGGHAMTIVGQEDQYYIMKNWWYGYPGFFRIKKDEIFKPKVFLEAWTGELI